MEEEAERRGEEEERVRGILTNYLSFGVKTDLRSVFSGSFIALHFCQTLNKILA